MKNIRSLLDITDVDSLVCFESKEVNISPSIVEKGRKILEELKSETYEDIVTFEEKLTSLLCSSKTEILDKIIENVCNFTMFGELLATTQKKRGGGYLSYFGSGLRSFGGYIRGGGRQEFEFSSLTEAIKKFEEKNPGEKRMYAKHAIGNILRMFGERLTGETRTLYRIIKYTTLGLNPFTKFKDEHTEEEEEEEDSMANRYASFFINSIMVVPRALLVLYHHIEEPIAGRHFIQYLYQYIFPCFGTMQDESIIRDLFTKEEEEEEGEKKTETENLITKMLFDKSVYDRIWYFGVSFYTFGRIFEGLENHQIKKESKQKQNNEGILEGVFSFFSNIYENVQQEEITEKKFVQECHKVNEKYKKIFSFRHFDNVEQQTDAEFEEKCLNEMEMTFKFLFCLFSQKK